MLRGFALQPEIRYRDENDEIHIEKPERRSVASPVGSQGLRRSFPNGYGNGKESRQKNSEINPFELEELPSEPLSSLKPINIYAYGVARNRLEQAAHRLGVPAKIARDLNQADMLITLKSYYRKRQRPILNAEERGIPIMVLRSNSVTQIEQVLAEIFNLSRSARQKYRHGRGYHPNAFSHRGSAQRPALGGSSAAHAAGAPHAA